jgi:hypothetical protein
MAAIGAMTPQQQQDIPRVTEIAKKFGLESCRRPGRERWMGADITERQELVGLERGRRRSVRGHLLRRRTVRANGNVSVEESPWNDQKFLASLRSAENASLKELKPDGNRAVIYCSTTDTARREGSRPARLCGQRWRNPHFCSAFGFFAVGLC